MAQLFIEIFKKEINIKHLDNSGFNIFDYGSSLIEECIQFIHLMFKINGNDIDCQFMNQYTRYGRNSLLNLCEDYVCIYMKNFIILIKKNSINYIRYEIK